MRWLLFFLLFGSWNIYQAKGSFFCTWCYKVERCALRLAISQRELLCQHWDRGDMKEDFCFSSRNTLLNKGVFSERKTKQEQSARHTLLLCSWSASQSPTCHHCHLALRGEINIRCLQLTARCICRVPSNSSQLQFFPAGTALRKLNYVGTHQLRQCSVTARKHCIHKGTTWNTFVFFRTTFIKEQERLCWTSMWLYLWIARRWE